MILRRRLMLSRNGTNFGATDVTVSFVFNMPAIPLSPSTG